MCSNWKRGDRKTDMTLEQIDKAFSSRPLEEHRERQRLGRRADDAQRPGRHLPDDARQAAAAAEVRHQHDRPDAPPRPSRCSRRSSRCATSANVIFSTRVSIDGVGDMHNEVRQVKRGFEKANETIRAMQALQKKLPVQLRHLDDHLPHEPRRCREHPGVGAEGEAGHRLQHGPLHRADARQHASSPQRPTPIGDEEERMRQFFLDRVRMDPLLDGQNYIYMHYADMIANGYHRLAPCPFQTQGIMLNPDGGLFFCENSDVDRERDGDGSGRAVLPRRQPGAPRLDPRREVPDLPQPVPDERRRHQAGRAVREVPRAGGAGKTPLPQSSGARRCAVAPGRAQGSRLRAQGSGLRQDLGMCSRMFCLSPEP